MAVATERPKSHVILQDDLLQVKAHAVMRPWDLQPWTWDEPFKLSSHCLAVKRLLDRDMSSIGQCCVRDACAGIGLLAPLPSPTRTFPIKLFYPNPCNVVHLKRLQAAFWLW